MAGFNTVIRVDGIEETMAALNKMGEVGEREIKRAILSSLNDIRNTAQKKMQRERKSGRIYERSAGRNLSPTHQASAKGEAPAVDTGALVNSIKVVQPKPNFGYVGTDIQYGFWLEYGTTRMGPRPWLNPSLLENRDKIIERFDKALIRATEAFK